MKLKRTAISKERKKELLAETIPIAQSFSKEYLTDVEYPLKDSFELLEQLGYLILKFPADENLSGFHVSKKGIECIFINSGHNLGRQYYSLWHEVYHSYTQEGESISYFNEGSYDEIECKADYFASLILMPTKLIKNYIRHYRINLKYAKYEDLIKMQFFFNVSYRALITRLIQIYPEYIDTLNKRYAISSVARSKEFQELCTKYVGTAKLSSPTNEFYISPIFYSSLNDNYSNNRITDDKIKELYSILEELKYLEK